MILERQRDGFLEKEKLAEEKRKMFDQRREMEKI